MPAGEFIHRLEPIPQNNVPVTNVVQRDIYKHSDGNCPHCHTERTEGIYAVETVVDQPVDEEYPKP